MNFTAIDFETAQGARWSICQVGIVRVENDKIVKTISTLIKPPKNEYQRSNTLVHGINGEITENSPTFPEVWPKIKEYIDGQLVVAHNSDFDINCLESTLHYYNLPVPKYKVDCTYKRTNLKLEDLCVALDIALDNHHDACCDALACANAYTKLLKNGVPDCSKIHQKANNPFDFSSHHKLCGDVLKPDLQNCNVNSPFYNKKIVFTGILAKYPREEAAAIVKKYGADIDIGITKRTNIVIMGNSAGPSKVRKIEKYNNEGCNIRVIEEEEFNEIINQL